MVAFNSEPLDDCIRSIPTRAYQRGCWENEGECLDIIENKGKKFFSNRVIVGEGLVKVGALPYESMAGGVRGQRHVIGGEEHAARPVESDACGTVCS